VSSKKVSIIVSAYNAEKHIAQTLESILAQTYSNLEIIVVDDGSTDKTLTILDQYRSNSVCVISQENKGQDAALNMGYKYCSGDFVKFMDSDDIINPEMIDLQLGVLGNSDEFVAYGEWARFYNDNTNSARFNKHDNWCDMAPIDFLTSTDIGPMLQCGIMLIPRKIIEKSGLWDERLILFNDTEFFTRVLLNSKGIKFSSGAKLYYRSGQENSISIQTKRPFFESTFLATCLIAKNLISFEDSVRVRKLISNMYLSQYYKLYPLYPELRSAHELKIKEFGYGTLKPYGGFVFNLFNYFFGWKKTRKLQVSLYKYINLPLIKSRFNKLILLITNFKR
jgi:glycosyltransferase involved in cell wall biosynthesis